MGTNLSGAHTNPAKKNKMQLAWIHTEKNKDSTAKQALQWTPQGHRNRGRPKNTWERDLEKEMWIAGFR